MSKIFKMAFEIAGELDSSFRNSFKSAGDEVKELQTQIKTLSAQQKKMDAAGLKQGTSSVWAEENRKKIEELTRAQERYASAQRMSDKAAAGREKYGGAFLKSAAVGALVFGPMINEAMEFESAMADVRKVVDFDTPEQYKEMQADIVKLSQSIPMTAEGLAAIVAAGGQAGIEREGLVAFAEDAAKMGVAFDISADQAGDMMAKWRTAFGMDTQEEVRALADQINFLSDSTAATAPQISGIISRIGPLGETAGISADQVAALGATLASMSISEENAATGIKNMMINLNLGASASKKQKAAFEELGFSAEEMARKMQKDGKGAILEVLGALKQLPEERRTAILTQLFGRESVAAIAPLLNKTEKLVENFEKVAHAENYAGSMAKEFASRSATTANAMQLAKNSISAVAITLGSMFLPAIAEGFKTVGDFANRIAAWAQANSETAKTIGTVAAGAIGLTMAVSGLGFAYNVLLGGTASVIKSFISLHTWLTVGTAATNGLTGAQLLQSKAAKIAAAAQWLWNAAMTANPIGLVIVGIAGLVAAGYLLYKNWDSLSQKAKAFWGVIWGFGKQVFDFYVDFWTKLPERAAYGVGYMIGFIATMPERIGYWGALAWNAMTDWVTGAMDSSVDLFMNFPSLAQAAFQNFTAAVKGWGGSVLESVKEWASQIPSIIMQAISDAGSNLKNWFFNIGNSFGAGKEAGASVAKNAKGGIYPKGEFLTTFAERSPEAAIPIENSQRARGLWEKTGELLGMSPPTAGGGFTYAPAITIQGNADAGTLNQLRQELERQKLDFKRMFDEMVANNKRVSY